MSRNNSNGFVEVSINSEKLSEFLATIQKAMRDQECRIDDINKRLIGKITETNDNTIRAVNDMKRNEKEIKQMVVTEVLLQKEELKKANQKTQILFETLHDKIKSVNTEIIQDKKAYEQCFHKTEYAFQQVKEIKLLKHMLGNLQKEIQQIRGEGFKQNIRQYLERTQEDKMGEICQDTFFKIIENDRLREIIQKKEYVSADRKSGRKGVVGEKQAIFFASISEKLEKLEQKLIQNNNVELNKVLYPSKTTNTTSGGGFFNSIGSSTNFSVFTPEQQHQVRDNRREEFENNMAVRGINTKVESLEQTMNKKIEEIKNELSRAHQKNQLFHEKLNQLTRKFEKQRSRVNDLAVDIKKSSDKKMDQKLIQTFRFQMRQKTMDYQDNLDAKLSKDIFEKEKMKINERIKIIHENLTQKTDKSEIKKAITFLESKIKEIILLVAGSYDQDRQGSIKKTPFKCLSCDKDLDTKLLQLKEKSKENSTIGQFDEVKIVKRSDSATKLRCATSRMRKHIRMNSGVNTGANTPLSGFQMQSFGFD